MKLEWFCQQTHHSPELSKWLLIQEDGVISWTRESRCTKCKKLHYSQTVHGPSRPLDNEQDF